MVSPINKDFVTQLFDIVQSEMDNIKAFFRMGEEEDKKLKELSPYIEKSLSNIIDNFYKNINSFSWTKAYFKNQDVLNRVKRAQHSNLINLFSADMTEEYLKNRVAVGVTHEKIRLPMQWYMGAFLFFIEEFSKVLKEFCREKGADFDAYYVAMQKRIFFDISIVMQTYIFARENEIKKQQKEILELSTPVLKIREGLLLVPLIGMLSSDRAYYLTEQLLQSIRRHSSKVVVIDVTGAVEVDTQTANHILLTINSCKLMGNEVLLTGISSNMAMTLVQLGVDFSGLTTLLDLHAGLVAANAMLDKQGGSSHS